MASVHRVHGSKFWHGAFTIPGGKRVLRSTKLTKRADALKVALAWEEAARLRMAEAQIRRVFSDIHTTIHGRPLNTASVRAYVAQWLERKKGEIGEASAAAYGRATADFISALGDRADADLLAVTPADVAKARDKWAVGASPKTANNKLKVLRALFQDAWRDGVVQDNPAAKVPALKTESTEIKVFTLAELQRVLAAAEPEWQGMILAGLYTGQRLVDIAMMRWNQVDLARNEVALTTRKTGRRIILPLAKPLAEWLTERAGDDAEAPIFPALHKKATGGGSAPLSQGFYEVLVGAGLAQKRSEKHKPTGKGRSAPRTRNPLTFHSLRHTATSWLKLAGVPEAVARDIIGHESAEVSRHYTHVDEAAKTAALAKLPEIRPEAKP